MSRLSCPLLGLMALILALGPLRADEGKTVTLEEKDTDKKVTLKKGDKLVLKLKQLSSAGYLWSVTKNDAKILKPVGEPTTEKPDKKLIGAAVTRVYTFEAVAPGKGGLELDYKRPFEKDKKPAKVFKATVEVE